MKSKKQLFVALDKFFNTDKYTKGGLKVVGNETYGRESYIYVSAGSNETRRELERFLSKEGFGVNFDYAPGHSTAEIRVSYFKGIGWDE